MAGKPEEITAVGQILERIRRLEAEVFGMSEEEARAVVERFVRVVAEMPVHEGQGHYEANSSALALAEKILGS